MVRKQTCQRHRIPYVKHLTDFDRSCVGTPTHSSQGRFGLFHSRGFLPVPYQHLVSYLYWLFLGVFHQFIQMDLFDSFSLGLPLIPPRTSYSSTRHLFLSFLLCVFPSSYILPCLPCFLRQHRPFHQLYRDRWTFKGQNRDLQDVGLLLRRTKTVYIKRTLTQIKFAFKVQGSGGIRTCLNPPTSEIQPP